MRKTPMQPTDPPLPTRSAAREGASEIQAARGAPRQTSSGAPRQTSAGAPRQTSAGGAAVAPPGSPHETPPGSSGARRAPGAFGKGRLGPALAMLAVGCGWGAVTAATKLQVSTGHHALGLAFWAFFFSCVSMGTLCLATRRRPPFASRRGLVFCAMVALLGTLVPLMFELASLRHLPAGPVAIAVSMTPMFSLLLSVALGVERPSLLRLTGVGLGAVSILMLLGPETALPDPEAWPWLLLVLLAPLSYAVEGLWVALRMPRGVEPMSALLGASVLGALVTGPAAALTPGAWVAMPGPFGPAEQAVLYCGLVSGLCYWGYMTLVRASGPVFASMVSYVVTGAGVLWSVWVLGETPSGWLWAALAAMIAGMALVRPQRAED